MAVSRRGLALLALLPWSLVSDAHADQPASCRVIDLDFTPGGFPATSKDPEIVPQIVAWLEKPNGEFVATLYITDETGRYGLGNRPGRFDFNSGPNWPYGRRVTVFPVWANRRVNNTPGVSKRSDLMFPQVNYQNGEDFNLSHPAGDSSPEVHFCRPLMTSEPSWDAASCPSQAYTDKGKFASGSLTALYPPRADVIPSIHDSGGQDDPSVEQYRNMNPFDAVSQASPRLGMETQVSWPIPPDLAMGDYVVFMEVSLERDFNDHFPAKMFPSPAGIPWAEYGVPYRGQPSVIYQVPITIGNTETVKTTERYFGYGDPGPSGPFDGKSFPSPDGNLRPRDDMNPMITIDRPGSGEARLLLTSKDGQLFRLRVDARTEPDMVAPAPPSAMAVVDTQAGGATLSFTAPGDDGMIGTVTGYDVHYRVGTAPIGDTEFDAANQARFTGRIVKAGELQTLVVANLLPETPYSFAVRAYDDCHNTGKITTVMFTTAPRKLGEVDACFIATAAYGSLLANDVEMLRRFRDRMLRHSVLGELAVETYYTFGPTVAGLIGESDLLRSTARDALAPLVRWVRQAH
jgi:hypothetical protein